MKKLKFLLTIVLCLSMIVCNLPVEALSSPEAPLPSNINMEETLSMEDAVKKSKESFALKQTNFTIQ